MTVIRKYFNECSDEGLIDLYYSSEFCEANCPVVQECKNNDKDNCLEKLKKYGLMEIEEK